MKDLLEKIGLGDLFAYVCPGTILLCSLLLWLDRTDLPAGVERNSWQSLAISIVLGILAYTLGLIVAWWSSEGAALYLRQAGRLRLKWTRARACILRLLGILHWIPAPRVNPSIIQSNLQITEDLHNFVQLQGLSSLEIPWDRLAIYRAIMADQVGDKAKGVLAEADSFHRRFLVSQGVALACALVAAQALVRLLLFPLWCGAQPVGVYVSLVVFGTMTSFFLRGSAGRWWEGEFLLTCSLTQLRKRPEQGEKAEPARSEGARSEPA
jgi:hypothetical protein